MSDLAPLALIKAPETGDTHTLIALGCAVVEAGLQVRYCTASEVVDIRLPGVS
jgi:UDP:flavonoid glycosyltransferase YjiC (YdhE family)